MSATIRTLVEVPDVANTVAGWLIEEWPDGLSLADRKARLQQPDDCPATLVVLIEDKAAGVLAFRRFDRTGDERPSLFIDALYVHTSFRNRGLGTALLASGVTAAAFIEQLVFVYTSLPHWYTARGWSVLEMGPDPECFVLNRGLP